MEISSHKPVSNQVQGLESTAKVSKVEREQKEAQQHRAQNEENPDYRISLSDESQQAVSKLAGQPTAGQSPESGDLSEQEAAQLAERASEQLSQTNRAIANQAIQKAVDLFT